MTCFAHVKNKIKKETLLVWESIRKHINNVKNVNLGCWFSSNTCNKVEIPLYDNAHVLSNVHTWASFFLRHLANMSFMVPFWASTDSGSVSILGSPHLKPGCQEEVVYCPNDSCLHFTQRLFPPNFPWQRTVTISL